MYVFMSASGRLNSISEIKGDSGLFHTGSLQESADNHELSVVGKPSHSLSDISISTFGSHFRLSLL